jgi:hypothetical protein
MEPPAPWQTKACPQTTAKAGFAPASKESIMSLQKRLDHFKAESGASEVRTQAVPVVSHQYEKLSRVARKGGV